MDFRTIASPMLRGLLVALCLLSGAMPVRAATTIWRVVDVIRPPWSSTPVAPAAQALRGTGLAFLDGAVKGPEPLNCDPAEIHERAERWTDIFGGQVGPQQIDATLAALHVHGSDAYVVRVGCHGQRFDYYTTDNGRVLLFAGALLILEQPRDDSQITDYDDWVKPLRPGFDCAQARSTTERLACSDYRLSVAYRKMAEAYEHLRITLSAESFATFRDAQRRWTPYVAALCKATIPMPQAWTDQRDIAECLRGEAEERTRLLATEVLTAGPLRLEPRMHAIYQHAPPREDTVVYPWLSGPSAEVFNKTVATRLQPATHYLTKDTVVDMAFEGSMYARRSYAVSAVTERLISLTLLTDFYGGGAHGSLTSQALNFDPRNSRVATLKDFFLPGSNWEAAITGLCQKSLSDERDGLDMDRVGAVVRNSAAWTFGPTSALVFFDVYTIASYSGGPSEVTLTYEQLRPYLSPNAPLP